MSDIVTYDQVASWDGKPYRSASLYKQDAAAVMRLRPGAAVQVITEPGDAIWTDATLNYSTTIEGGMIIRFHVTIPDIHHPKGERQVMVSEDRIRPRP